MKSDQARKSVSTLFELMNSRAHVSPKRLGPPGPNSELIELIVSAYFSSPSTAGPFIKEGKLIPLGVTSVKRSPFFPKVPSIAESGYAGFDSTNWYAFVAPGKTPPAILDSWNKALVKVLKDKEVVATLGEHNFTAVPMSRDELSKFMTKESSTWAKVVKEKNITEE